MNEFPRYDDVGSFPLPEYIDKETFNQFYWSAYKALVNKTDMFSHRGIYNNVIHSILQSFHLKLNAGVEIINYPQHVDMYTQFLKPIKDHETEPNLIHFEKALIPEMFIIDKFAREFYERIGKSLELKICITGPIELYIKKLNFTIYFDMAMNFARSVNFFLKNSIINTKYMKTSIVSIDEPSFGYIELFNITEDELIKIFDKALDGINASNQIHLHSLNQAQIPLQAKNIDVLTSEYASDKSNKIPRKELERHDKYMRVGIARTNINSLMAEALDSGISSENLKSFEGTMNLIDSRERIKQNLLDAMNHYGDRLKYIGPDCGLSGWSPPQVAYELLHRIYTVIHDFKKSFKW